MTRILENPSQKITVAYLRDSFSNIPILLNVILWVLGLWIWGSLVNLLPSSISLVVVGITALPALTLFWKNPEYGVIALMFFVSGFLSPEFIEIRLPIGGGLEMGDILLFSMFGITFFQRLYRRNLVIPLWPAGGLLIGFLVIVVSSLLNAIVFENVPINWAFNDARILSYYSIFLIVGWSITNKQSLYVVILGSFIIADITALIVILQQFFGINNLILPAMSDPRGWSINYLTGGAVRVVPPGIVYIYFMMFISLGFMFFLRANKNKLVFWTANSVFLGISLLFTFTRSAWVASGISIALLAIVLFRIYQPYLLRILLLGCAFLMFVVGLLGLFIDFGTSDNPIVRRFTSIFEEDTVESLSLQWRLFELQEATKAILESPILGVGLGNSYRNLTTFNKEAIADHVQGDHSYIRYDRFTRYVHSSYWAIAVKMGFPGILVLMAFFIVVIFKSIFLYSSLSNDMAKGLTITVGLAMFGLLQWSIMHAQLMLESSTIVIGLVLGLLASINSIYIMNRNPN